MSKNSDVQNEVDERETRVLYFDCWNSSSFKAFLVQSTFVRFWKIPTVCPISSSGDHWSTQYRFKVHVEK